MKKILSFILSVIFAWYVPSLAEQKSLTRSEITSRGNEAVAYFTRHKKSINFQALTRSLCEKFAQNMLKEDAARLSLFKNEISFEEKKKIIRWLQLSKNILQYYEWVIEGNGIVTAKQVASLEPFIKEFDQLYKEINISISNKVPQIFDRLTKIFGNLYTVSVANATEDETRLWSVFISDIQRTTLSDAFDIFIRAHVGNAEVMDYFTTIAFPNSSKLIKLRYWSVRSFFKKERPFFFLKEIALSYIDNFIKVIEK